MKIEFNRSGKQRKELAQAIGEYLNEKPKYQGMPSMAYVIGGYTIDKEGTLETNESEGMAELLSWLENEKGISATMQSEDEGTRQSEEEAALLEKFSYTVSMPKNKVNMDNLLKILESKGKLIKKALEVDSLEVSEDEQKVSFPWFFNLTESEIHAYTAFISKLCEMSQKLKRVNESHNDVENEKYAFRCFLLRLGFIGSEYKQDRIILLKNLKGSSAFKYGKSKGEKE